MFEPNSHSQWQVRWKPASSECFAEVCAVLGQDYSTYGVQSVEQVDEWEHASNNYRVMYRLAGGLPHEFLLRRHIMQGPDAIRASTAISRHLREHEIATPAVYLADGRRRFVEYGGGYWQMFEFVPGNHFCGKEDELALATILIAQMHHVFDSISPTEFGVGGVDKVIGPLEPAYWETISHLTGMNAFEELVIAKQAFIREHISSTADVLHGVACGYELIHGDLHPQNFLFLEKWACVILDFGNACVADSHYDIAMALHRLVRQYVVYRGIPWQETLAGGISIFLNAYASVQPRITQELATLPVFMRALLLRKMAHNMRHYLEGDRGWESCLSQWQKFLGFFEEIDAIEAVLPTTKRR